MSGLCGWYAPGAGNAADAGLQQLARMTAPLTRFDLCSVQSATGAHSAAAVAARSDSANFYQQDGLLIAIWGRPGVSAGALAPLWRSGGVKACAELSGPFAVCILDERNGEAMLAIDRSGTHALCYQVTALGLIFASSVDALARHPAARRELDPQAIYNYLYFHVVPAPHTIYQGQQRLLPGEYLHYCGGKVQRGTYWTMHFSEREKLPFDALKSEFLATLHSSVEETIGAHQVGAFLSGGTDSSGLAGVLGQVSGRAARTYSIGFAADGYDEMEYARIAARHFGTEHHELYVTADDVVNAIPRIAAIFDQPFGNASAVPAFYCAQMAQADGITRLLGGDGGDELFGGNERYARQAQFAWYERIPCALRQVLIEPLLFKAAGALQQALLCKARSYIKQASVPLPGRLDTYNLLQGYGNSEVLEADFLASTDPGAPSSSLKQKYRETEGHSQINRMLALDLKFTLADNDLPKVVKACELARMEVAFPFLNDAMVAFSARLAPSDKLKGTKLRHFYKEAMRGILPDAILRKKKHGFGLPFGVWLQHHRALKALAFDSLSDLKARRIVRAGFIDDLLSRHLPEHPGYHGTMVWVLMMLEQWFKHHQDTAHRLPMGSFDANSGIISSGWPEHVLADAQHEANGVTLPWGKAGQLKAVVRAVGSAP